MTQLAQEKKEPTFATESPDSFKEFLKGDARFKIKENIDGVFPGVGPEEKVKLEAGITAFINNILRNPAYIGRDALKTIDAMIDSLDNALEKGVNAVIHHPNFQQVESTWRGLHYMVSRTITGNNLKVRVMDLSKVELEDMMEKYEGVVFDQSPLFKKVFDKGIGAANGDIFGCLTGDYHFGPSARDVMTLKGVAKLAAVSHCPFISGAAPSIFGLSSWTKINDPPQLETLVSGDTFAAWNGLRAQEDSRYIGLAMPRFISRQPYGPNTVPVKEFNFREDTATGDHSRYLWSNSAYAMAAGINRAFAYDGYCGRIRGYYSGGRISGLPIPEFKSNKGVQTKCPTEIEIPQRREAELGNLGLMPLVHWEKTDEAVFVGAQSLQNPKEYEGIDGKTATANAALSARLPYIFITSRIAHYLKRLLYKQVGKNGTKESIGTDLNNWLHTKMIVSDPNATEEERAQHPLRDGSVEVRDDEERPGYFEAIFKLCPHIQIEGVSVMLKLVSKMKDPTK